MKRRSLLGTLLVLSFCRINGLIMIYDFSDQLNAIREGTLSVQTFSENIMSFFVGRNLSSALRLEGNYALDCNILEECENSIKDVIQILNDTNIELRTQMLEIRDFQLQFRMNTNTLKKLTLPMNQSKLVMPTGTYLLSITLAENTTCDDLQNISKDHWKMLLNRSNWFTPETVNNVLRIGFGYNEDLIDCKELFNAIRSSPFLVTSFSLGKTPGVVESYGIFRKQMENLHAQNIQFVKNAMKDEYNGPFIEYYPTLQSVGDEVHRIQLNSYWQKYDKNTDHNIGAITPYFANNRSWILAEHSYSSLLIPNIDAESCYN